MAFYGELAKANNERLAVLQMFLSRAMKSEDIDQTLAVKKKIDEAEAESALIQKKSDKAQNALSESDDPGKNVVFLCQSSGSMLGNLVPSRSDSRN